MRSMLATVLLLSWAPLVSASPILWTLTDVSFAGGGTATGSFIYDADTNSYSSISITTTNASLTPIATFTTLLGGSATDAAFAPTAGPNQTGQPFLQLIYFQFPLTNAGGTLYLINPFFPATGSFDGTCSNAACSAVTYGRLMVDGGIIGTAVSAVVPIPPAALLFPGAATALIAFRRRR